MSLSTRFCPQPQKFQRAGRIFHRLTSFSRGGGRMRLTTHLFCMFHLQYSRGKFRGPRQTTLAIASFSESDLPFTNHSSTVRSQSLALPFPILTRKYVFFKSLSPLRCIIMGCLGVQAARRLSMTAPGNMSFPPIYHALPPRLPFRGLYRDWRLASGDDCGTAL